MIPTYSMSYRRGPLSLGNLFLLYWTVYMTFCLERDATLSSKDIQCTSIFEKIFWNEKQPMPLVTRCFEILETHGGSSHNKKPSKPLNLLTE